LYEYSKYIKIRFHRNETDCPIVESGEVEKSEDGIKSF